MNDDFLKEELGVKSQSLELTNFMAVSSFMTPKKQESLAKILGVRKKDGNKGDFGQLVLFCGSENMCGAASITAMAASKCGVGLIKTFGESYVKMALDTHIPMAVNYLLKESKGSFLSKNQKGLILDEINKSSAICIGPGLSTDDKYFKLLKFVVENSQCNILIDADGINLLASGEVDLKCLEQRCIITPHPKEFSRLIKTDMNKILEDPDYYILKFVNDTKISILLKGAGAKIVAFKPNKEKLDKVINISYENSGLSKGGSGDVLAGIISAFLAVGNDIENSMILGEYIFNLAANFATNEFTEYSQTPIDLINKIHLAFKTLI